MSVLVSQMRAKRRADRPYAIVCVFHKRARNAIPGDHPDTGKHPNDDQIRTAAREQAKFDEQRWDAECHEFPECAQPPESG